MKDEELPFDRNCHVLYSKSCKKQIKAKIALHYSETERENVWERVQQQYVTYLSDCRTDLGGKKNFHNGTDGTYDCIVLMSYYTVCKAVASVNEIEEMENELFLSTFRKLCFVDCNKPFWKRILHWSFAASEKKCNAWHDYEMNVAPYDKSKRVYYEFTACPIGNL